MRSMYAGLLLALLAACGTAGDDTEGVTGQEPPDETPTTAPTGPPWPDFPHDDYTFVYAMECFCGYAGVRIEVTVDDGRAVRAAYAGRGETHGEPITAESALITLDDVIALADTQGAAKVEVEWPAGQEYPERVWVDRQLNAADEELGYRIYRVLVAD